MARPHSHKRAARLAAITILTALGALAAVWAAPRVSDAAAGWMTTPAVEVRSAVLPGDLPVAQQDAPAGMEQAPAQPAPAGAEPAPAQSLRSGSRAQLALPGSVGARAAASAVAGPVTIDAGMRFTMAGVTCAPPRRRGDVVVQLRTSDDGVAWSRWYSLDLERAADGGGPLTAFTDPIWTGGARYLQVRAAGAPVAAGSSRRSAALPTPTHLRKVRVVAINSTEDADRASAVVGVLRRTAVAVSRLRLVSPASAMTTKPRIVTRSQWGANESWRSGSPTYAPVKVAFVHHTAGGNGYTASQAASIVRGVYAYHTKSLHWSDIGYNFLIDRFGTIYEGRYGGMTRGPSGAQVLGFNTGSTGISVIGTYSSRQPPSAVLTSLKKLLAWKLDVHHINPLGTGTLVCGYGQKFSTGQRVTFPAIAGHRDANFTDCPGARLYGQLPNIRKVVERRGQPKIYGFVAENRVISPNGDGIRDAARVRFTVSRPATWRLDVTDAAGVIVRRLEGTGTRVRTSWDGSDNEGRPLPDGVYRLTVGATSAEGKARPATSTVRLDCTAPTISGVSLAPNPFSPNGDGQADTTVLSYTPDEAGRARVSVLSAGGAVQRRLSGWQTVAAKPRRARWDGRVTKDGRLVAAPEGEAVLLVELRDQAGNTTGVRRSVMLDKTLKLLPATGTTLSPNGDGKNDAVSIGFRLKRSAEVTASIVHAGTIVQTLNLGRLGSDSGKPTSGSVTWDGTLAAGGTATSGRYVLTLAADGALGVTKVTRRLTVDLAAPIVKAPATASVRRGGTAKLAYSVRDPYSPTVNVTAKIAKLNGAAVATVRCGWVAQGVGQACRWRPPSRRGTYRVTFRATDLGGNRQKTVAVTRLRVL